jgi:DNA invertase Pin-like site-specific DNA recombinase
MRAALYARFSTDKQASIDDQLRVCRSIAEQHGLDVVATFEDAAISGGTSQRPGYQALLAAARRHDVDVIVAEDASRLWRNMAEQSPRLAELRDLGVHVITADLDTRQEASEWMGAILGTAASAYRSEIARRTRRGLEGRALKAMPTGGKAYGYETVDGKRVVVPEQATIIREIFQRFANGESAQALAVALNARGVTSPGVAWNRSTRRRGGWHPSAIAGDRKRGVGIVNSDLYRGLVVWNRCRWVRLASDSKKRRVVLNPESAWVKRPDESLRIVSDALWQAVRRRQHQAARAGRQACLSGSGEALGEEHGPGRASSVLRTAQVLGVRVYVHACRQAVLCLRRLRQRPGLLERSSGATGSARRGLTQGHPRRTVRPGSARGNGASDSAGVALAQARRQQCADRQTGSRGCAPDRRNRQWAHVPCPAPAVAAGRGRP